MYIYMCVCVYICITSTGARGSSFRWAFKTAEAPSEFTLKPGSAPATRAVTVACRKTMSRP